MANPTYQSGFYAPGRGTALHPELWDGCVGAWNPGLGNTGLSLRDWSGGQNDGTLVNGPTWGVSDGRQALTLDGSDDQVNLGVAGLLTAGRPYSLSWWENVVSNTGTYPGRFVLKINGASSHFVVLRSKSDNNYTHLSWGPSPSGSTLRSEQVAPLSASVGAWKHFAITALDPTSTLPANYSVFEDGIQKTVTGGGTYNAVSGNIIGYINANQGADAHITDTRIYNRALSPNEIRTLAQRPGIAYERAPRKFYSLPAAAASSRQYRLFRPSILRGA